MTCKSWRKNDVLHRCVYPYKRTVARCPTAYCGQTNINISRCLHSFEYDVGCMTVINYCN